MDVRSIRGAGPEAFMRLSTDSLKMWAAALQEVLDPVGDPEGVTLERTGESEDGSPRYALTGVEDKPIEITVDVPSRRRSRDWLRTFLVAGTLIGVGFLVVKVLRRLKLVRHDGDGEFKDGTHFSGPLDVLWSDTGWLDEGGEIVESSISTGASVDFQLSSDIRPLEGRDVLDTVVAPADRTSRYRITSGYGYRGDIGVEGASTFHRGVDIAMPVGTPVRAIFDGIITEITTQSKGGKIIRLQSTDGQYEAAYLHLSDNTLRSVGDRVRKGDIVAKSGNTGIGSGAHLHLQLSQLSRGGSGVRRRVVNPMYFDTTMGTYAGPPSVTSPIPSGDVRVPERPSRSIDVMSTPSGSVFRTPEAMSGTNNVVAIMDSGDDWVGKTGVKPVSRNRKVVRFETPQHSLRAGMRIMQTYQTRDISHTGGESVTLRDITDTYVTQAYGDDLRRYRENVARFSGYGVDEPIDVREPETVKRVVGAIARQESGSIVSQEDLDAAYSMLDVKRGNTRYNATPVGTGRPTNRGRL